jgi:hypothetical protein
MTPERIKLFLRYFYEQYVNRCYKGCEVVLEDGSIFDMEQYDISQYMINNLEIYIEHCDHIKEYSVIYNPFLFNMTRQEKPEDFNKLQIFMIENIQLFFHAILESVVCSTLAKDRKVKKIKLFFRMIDNGEVKLMDLVTSAEEQMKINKIQPPSA